METEQSSESQKQSWRQKTTGGIVIPDFNLYYVIIIIIINFISGTKTNE